MMLSKIKREPVLVAAVIVAALNLIAGGDSGVTQESVESLLLLLTGLIVRSKVSPVAGHRHSGAECC